MTLAQELCRGPGTTLLLEGQLAGRRLQASFKPSVVTDAGGLSAGVGLMAAWSATLAKFETDDLDKRHPGRVVAGFWGGLLTKGALALSVYAYAEPDAAGLNADLLETVAREVNATRVPFIIGGDWNIKPEILLSSVWVARFHGILCAPKIATCNDSLK